MGGRVRRKKEKFKDEYFVLSHIYELYVHFFFFPGFLFLYSMEKPSSHKIDSSTTSYVYFCISSCSKRDVSFLHTLHPSIHTYV